MAKDGKISAIVPFATHIDHTEHDTMGIVTEYGFADLRGKSPSSAPRKSSTSARTPTTAPILWDYFKRAYARSQRRPQSPHMLDEAFGFHTRYLNHGTMQP